MIMSASESSRRFEGARRVYEFDSELRGKRLSHPRRQVDAEADADFIAMQCDAFRGVHLVTTNATSESSSYVENE